MSAERVDLSFVVPAAGENRWSDLLATLVSTDPAPLSALLGVDFDGVRREVTVSGDRSRRADRLDLLLRRGGEPAAVVEVKLLSDLGPNQLARYRAAFPGADAYVVLHLAQLPVNLSGLQPWRSLHWEDVLRSYAKSGNPWVAMTASAWLEQMATLVPAVGPHTVWNDVPDDAPGLELALRARVSWLVGRLDEWCGLGHDIVQSSGGGNWAVRLWGPTVAADHLLTVELQEGLTAYEWKPDPARPYRDRLPGPVVLVGLRQEPVVTSADFDWKMLHDLFAENFIDENGVPRDDRAWQTTAARPNHPLDRANWQTMVSNGAPRWLGKGWGMKVAETTGACLFGARFGLAPDSNLHDIDRELRRVASVIEEVAAVTGQSSAHL